MCGIAGIYKGKDAPRVTAAMLGYLQHRGMASAGAAATNGEYMRRQVGVGLADSVFTETILRKLHGESSIGHTRYGTTGSDGIDNAQPIVVDGSWGQMALVHNGNVDASHHRDRLKRSPFRTSFNGETDSEVIARHLNSVDAGSLKEAIMSGLPEIQGAYSLLIMSNEEFFAVRDPYGIRPLAMGIRDGSYVFASETSALDAIDAKYAREVFPGEVIHLSRDGLTSSFLPTPLISASCAMEYVYLADPASRVFGHSVSQARRAMGKILAREHPVDADIVVAVPESARIAAQGYSAATGIPIFEGLIRHRFKLHRNFMLPNADQRKIGAKRKMHADSGLLAGQRVALIDDSIVRGDTLEQIVELIYEAGAKEVHVLISSPPVRWPCFYGIATPTRGELIAADLSVEQIRQRLRVASLGYLSLDGLLEAIEHTTGSACHACFTGEYPVATTETHLIQIENGRPEAAII